MGDRGQVTLLVDPFGDQWTESASGLLLPEQPKRLTAVDLFCGCGGFSLGIIESGFDVLAGVDWAEDASVSYMMNLGAYPIDLRFVDNSDRDRLERHLQRSLRSKKGDVSMFETSGSNRVNASTRPGWTGVPVFWLGDVRKLTGRQILDSIGLDVGELDLVFGGPPCQGFSTSGLRNVMDPRNSLVFDFARLVCEMKPKTMALENVPGMLSMVTPEGVPVIDELCAILARGDYGEHEALVRMMSGDPSRKIARRGKGQKAAKAQGKQCELWGGP